jgi:asparagine synthase (glutamine-hydrolysing)
MARVPVSHANMSLDFKIKRTLRGLSHDPRLWCPVWMGPLAPEDLEDLFREPADIDDLYSEAIEQWEQCRQPNLVDRTLQFYTKLYLQDDILVKVDRASMATSLEVRSPFLDPAIIDFALSLPTSVKLPGMRRKDPLRRLMRNRIPDRIIDRPKRGFGVPLSGWLRGPLLPLVQDYLSDQRLAAGGYFDPAGVRAILDRHIAGSDDAGNQVWLLLQFEMWRDRWITGYPPVAAS